MHTTSAIVFLILFETTRFASAQEPTQETMLSLFSEGVLREVKSIQPGMINLISSSGARYCVKPVEILDSDRACKKARCLKTFTSRRATALSSGDRALLASPCGQKQSESLYLLWGSKSVLILQSDREGLGLWRRKQGDLSSSNIELETEANKGILSKTPTGFAWTED